MATKKPVQHGEPHAPEPQAPEKKGKAFARGKGAVDEGRRDFLRVAGVGGLAALLGFGKKARADETVASAGTTNARGHAEPSVATQTGREVLIENTEPILLSAEKFKSEYSYMFENRNATIVDLPDTGTTTLGNWEIVVEQKLTDIGDMRTIYVRNASLGYETTVSGLRGGKAILLPFPETEFAKGPMLAVVHSYSTEFYFYNKVRQAVGIDHISHVNFFGAATPKIGTDVYQNEPYIVLAPEGSLTMDGDMRQETRFLQYALLVTTISRNGDGPAPSGALLERRD